MKKTLVALSLAALTVPAFAQDKKAPEPDYTISGNFGLTSDYRFRGISQSNKKPAVQGGIDFEHKSGFYLGNWNSSVSEWTAANGAGLEMDFYGGYATEIAGVGLDLGAIYYYYPGAKINTTSTKNEYNTQEIYIGLEYGPVSFKTSYTLSDRYFSLGKDGEDSLQGDANKSSKGTLYYDLGFSYEIAPKVTLKAHAGLLALKDKVGSDIKDYSVGLAYDLSGWELGLNFYQTSGLNAADKTFFTSATNKKLYDSGAAISITKTF